MKVFIECGEAIPVPQALAEYGFKYKHSRYEYVISRDVDGYIKWVRRELYRTYSDPTGVEIEDFIGVV